jgi:hypothetical protein
MFSNFLSKNGAFRDNVEKYGTAGQATQDKIYMAHVHCVLDN